MLYEIVLACAACGHEVRTGELVPGENAAKRRIRYLMGRPFKCPECGRKRMDFSARRIDPAPAVSGEEAG